MAPDSTDERVQRRRRPLRICLVLDLDACKAARLAGGLIADDLQRVDFANAGEESRADPLEEQTACRGNSSASRMVGDRV